MSIKSLKKSSSVKRNIDWILDQTVADHVCNLIHYCGQENVLVSMGKTRVGDLCLTFTGQDIDKTTEYFQDKETFVLRVKEILSD